MAEKTSSIIFNCSSDTGKTPTMCDDLLGKYVTNLSAGPSEVIALCTDGMYLANGEKLDIAEFVEGSCSDNHYVGIAISGQVYTWGKGPFGELGQGIGSQDLTTPLPLALTGTFQNVSCGEFHSVICDEQGNAFSWGQNFDRQLGLYEKKHAEMRSKTAVIDEISFYPRLIPISHKNPVAKAACGSKFTVLVTRAGDVLTCGAGECGQLGTGKCTKKETFTQVNFAVDEDGSPVDEKPETVVSPKIVDAACGWAHCIVVDDTGTMYSWGLNLHGQLGLGDEKKRFYPCMIRMPVSSEKQVVKMRKLYAHTHSSAGINNEGKLYTWGSGKYGRLMQNGSEKYMNTPTLVSYFENIPISRFAFASRSSAVQIHSKLFSLSPPSGPQKSFSKLTIKGLGFWETDTILVKFTALGGSGFAAPRSCIGRYVSEGIIECKPPKLGEVGDYEVAVSLDGSLFLPTTLKVEIYKDLSVNGLSPSLLDMRDTSRMRFVTSLSGLSSQFTSSKVIIQAKLYTSMEDVLAGSAPLREFTQEGSIESASRASMQAPPSPAKSVTTVSAAELASGSTDRLPPPGPPRKVRFDLDRSQLPALEELSSTLYLCVFVSLNGQDFFGSLNHDYAMMHAFEPNAIVPHCVPGGKFPYRNMDASADYSMPANPISVLGTRFFRPQDFPSNYKLEANFAIVADGVNASVMKAVKPVDTDKLQIEAPSMEDCVKAMLAGSEASGDPLDRSRFPAHLNLRISFRLIETCESTGKRKTTYKLSNTEVPFTIYTVLHTALTPRYCRRGKRTVVSLASYDCGGLGYIPPGATLSVLQAESGVKAGFPVERISTLEEGVDDLVGFTYEGVEDEEGGPKHMKHRTDTVPFPAGASDVPDSGESPYLPCADSSLKAVAFLDLQDDFFMEAAHIIHEDKEVEAAKAAEAGLGQASTVSETKQEDPKKKGKGGSRPTSAHSKVSASSVEGSDVSPALVQSAWLGLLVDGSSPVEEEYMAMMTFFNTIQILPAAKMPPGVPGTPYTIDVGGLPQHPDMLLKEKLKKSLNGSTDDAGMASASVAEGEATEVYEVSCCVRIKGSATPHTLEINGTMNFTDSKLTFTVPEAAQLTEVAGDAKKAAAKQFYIGVSIDDGQSWDYSEKAVLQIK